MDKAAAGDRIYVAEGTYTGSGSDDQVVIINKDLFLSGGWNDTFDTQLGYSVLDGEGERRGIELDSGLSLEHFWIRNGHSNGGTGIYSRTIR